MAVPKIPFTTLLMVALEFSTISSPFSPAKAVKKVLTNLYPPKDFERNTPAIIIAIINDK